MTRAFWGNVAAFIAVEACLLFGASLYAHFALIEARNVNASAGWIAACYALATAGAWLAALLCGVSAIGIAGVVHSMAYERRQRIAGK